MSPTTTPSRCRLPAAGKGEGDVGRRGKSSRGCSIISMGQCDEFREETIVAITSHARSTMILFLQRILPLPPNIPFTTFLNPHSVYVILHHHCLLLLLLFIILLLILLLLIPLLHHLLLLLFIFLLLV